MTNQTEGLRVLVVEDEMLVAMMLEDMLAELGYAVVGPLATLDAALAWVEGELPDAALLDINLDGQEVYLLAERLAAGNVPFAFVTGYDDSGVDAAWRGRPLLEKPFRRHELELLVSALFEAD